jgi:hypothetical protein
MSITVSELVVDTLPAGDDGSITKRSMGKITFDTSYPTNGEVCHPSMIGLDDIDLMFIQPLSGATSIIPNLGTTDKLLVYAAGTQVANGSNLGTLTCFFEARQNISA